MVSKNAVWTAVREDFDAIAYVWSAAMQLNVAHDDTLSEEQKVSKNTTARLYLSGGCYFNSAITRTETASTDMVYDSLPFYVLNTTDGNLETAASSVIGIQGESLNTCQDGAENTFVVGTERFWVSNSNQGHKAFVAKLHPSNFSSAPLWKQFILEANPQSTAFGCSWIPGQDLMYVAGWARTLEQVTDDTFMGWQEGTSNDILVAQLNTTNGDVQWARQFGFLNGDNDLSIDGGIETDRDGNAIVFGTTYCTDELFPGRELSHTKVTVVGHVFVATLSKSDGSFTGVRSEPCAADSRGSRGGEDWIVMPVIVAVVALILGLLCFRRRAQQQKKIPAGTKSTEVVDADSSNEEDTP